MNHREQSFTLIELMIVVVIISVIAGFAIPSYQKAIEKNEEKTAIVKLQAIVAGMKIYKTKHGSYPDFDMYGLTSINQNLGLNIVPDTMIYRCLVVLDGEVNACAAIYPSPNRWKIHWHELGILAPNTIHCGILGFPCPSCPAPADGSCG